MSSKIDTISTMRDRQESRSEKTTSNAQYVKDLKSVNSLKPPQKLFKEDSDFINRSTTTPKKDSKLKAAQDKQDLNVLKEKFQENASGKESPGKESKKKELTQQIQGKTAAGVDEVNALLEKSKLEDQGPQIMLYDAMERYELAQSKYLAIKKFLPEKIKNSLEAKLEKLRKKIDELSRRVKGASGAGPAYRPPQEEGEGDGDGFGLGNIADKISTLSDLGLPIIPGKKRDKKKEEDPKKTNQSGLGLPIIPIKKRDKKEDSK